MSAQKCFQNILPMVRVVDIFSEEAKSFLVSAKCYTDKEFQEDVEDDTEDTEEIPWGRALCTSCYMVFNDFHVQREHFKSGWHRYNVKEKTLGNPCLSQQEWEKLENSLESNSSDSSYSSTSESEEDLEPTSINFNRTESVEEAKRTVAIYDEGLFFQHPTRTFFVTKQNVLFSLYKHVCPVRKTSGIKELFDLTPHLNSIWIYLMLSGGHFAAAVFDKKNALAHKTFHRYVVRAKRGTIQSAHDKKQGNAKSAGATIRRHNEKALEEDILLLLQSWRDHLNRADKIFYKCSVHQSNVLFNDNTGLYPSKDNRLSKISIMTNRPTLKEVKRIHMLYSTIQSHGFVSDVENIVKDTMNKRTGTTKHEKGGDVPTENAKNTTELSEQNGIEEDTHIELTVHQKSKKTKKKNNSKRIDTEKTNEEKVKGLCIDENEETWNAIYKALKQKQYKRIHTFLSPPNVNAEIDTCCNAGDEFSVKDSISSSNMKENESTHMIHNLFSYDMNIVDLKRRRMYFLEKDSLNFCSPLYKETLLHGAVSLNSREMVTWFMEMGADPSITNTQGKVPYDVATEKEIRNEFRRFMAKYPEKYDYKLAKIPSPLTPEQEAEQRRKNAEKKKQQQKARKEKLKVQKAAEKEEKIIEKERKAFDTLSDREKRAAMAERRFASQLTNSQRCSNCRKPLGKDVFERYEFKYCSTNCVHDHKLVIGK